MDPNKLDITNYLKKLLQTPSIDKADILSDDDIRELLRDDSSIVDDEPRENIFGYPTRPLYREIGSRLMQWLETTKCPILDLPDYDLLDEKEYKASRLIVIEEISPLLSQMSSLWTLWSEDERLYSLRNILAKLTRRGLLDLLGMRKTVGTSDFWPPPRRVLEKTFTDRHSPESTSMLTVGARALAKHCHRDESSSWWGQCTGTEDAKNKHAFGMMTKILDGATWINIHQLPQDVKIVESRQENGYGVRWTCDGRQFRGFLEPQMVDGHEVGWRH